MLKIAGGFRWSSFSSQLPFPAKFNTKPRLPIGNCPEHQCCLVEQLSLQLNVLCRFAKQERDWGLFRQHWPIEGRISVQPEIRSGKTSVTSGLLWKSAVGIQRSIFARVAFWRMPEHLQSELNAACVFFGVSWHLNFQQTICFFVCRCFLCFSSANELPQKTLEVG